QVPDLLASRIMQETIVPRIRSGDNAGAVRAGMEAVAQAIGQPLPGAAAPPPVRAPPGLTLGRLIFYGIIGLLILGFLGSSPGFAMWLLMSLISGGNRRGGRRGGGGRGGGCGG